MVTGATVIGSDSGKSLRNVELSDLGEAKKVISSYDKTIIVEGKGDKEKLDERMGLVRSQIAENKAEFDLDILKRRLAKLSGGVALIKVGAQTEMEAKEVKDRYDDALCATRCAQEEGIVKGGGVAFIEADGLTGDTGCKDHDEGIRLVSEALYAPFKQITKNSGIEFGHVIPSFHTDRGFNAITGETVENVFKEGIVDPAKVTRKALEDAVSVAGLMITTESVVDRTENLKKADELRDAFNIE